MAETRCAYPGCNKGYKTHRWSDIKAHDAGWFQQKDGRSWCPEHIPDWVVHWRSRQTDQNTHSARDDGWPAEDPESRDQR